MKLYIIAGEASGDLHGANLVHALKAQHPDVQLRGIGGDRMEAQGVRLVKHIRDTQFMGFVEVVSNLRTIMRMLREVKRDIRSYQPDAVVLIDYPGFNLRIAQFAYEYGYRVFYYISPQLWAWKKGRVRTIWRAVERMYVILPFEKQFYAQEGVEVDFVGHPLIDAIEHYRDEPMQTIEGLDGRPILALLPGSRKQEVSRMLPVMLRAARKHPEVQPVVAQAPSLSTPFYHDVLRKAGYRPDEVLLCPNKTYALLSRAHAAMVTSGTATLETALFGVPQVVCYAGGALSFWIAKRLVKVKYISLVNLILDKPLVRELIQGELNEANLGTELDRLLTDKAYRTPMAQGYQQLRQTLGGPGASALTAQLLIKRLVENT